MGKKTKEIAEKAESNKISTEGDNSEKAKYEKEAKKLAEECNRGDKKRTYLKQLVMKWY